MRPLIYSSNFWGYCDDAVGRGDSRGCERFLFVENCGGDACGARVFHQHSPGVVVVERGANAVPFAAVFGECLPMLWRFIDECFHVDGDEGCGIVVVWAIHMDVGRDLGVCSGLAE